MQTSINQNERTIILGTGQLAVAARNAETAEKQFQLSQQALQMDARSWIQPTFYHEHINAVLNSGYTEPFGMVNIGKSPASNVYAKVVLEFLYKGDHLEFDYKNLNYVVEAGLLFPNSPRGRDIPATDIGPDGHVKDAKATPRFAKSYDAGQAYIVMYGRITYRDKLGEHWTTFCNLRFLQSAIAQPKALGEKCSAYNQTD